jgi:penicillin-binding protein 1A
LYRILKYIFLLGLSLSFFTAIGLAYLFYINSKDLPSYEQLASYQPPIVTRFYAADGKLLEEYAKEHRLFLPIDDIPPIVKNAFIAAEDKNFYSHPGIDFMGILRAFIKNVISAAQGKKNLVGGSTITQQVVKNFLLTNEKSINRKIKEAILSFRISNVFTKDKILELYLNEIFLGARSYGVASAALNYFNKSLDELNLQEAAFLAALPQAPSYYNPYKNLSRALSRRNWVVERMYEEGFVTKENAIKAIKNPIKLINRDRSEVVKADFFAETVRKKVADMYGEESLYEGGLMVRTSLNPDLQVIAETALRNGLIKYDQKYGYKGPVANISVESNWETELSKINPYNMNIKPWRYAVILNVTDDQIIIGLSDGSKVNVNIAESKWALFGKKYKKLFSIGDVIVVDQSKAIKQVPKINGALVAMDPNTGRVLALVGGYSFDSSKFNRATQAYRQPGSSFKTFVYLAALENNLTPSSIFDDSPVELEQGPGLPLWRPKNFYGDFLGEITLRRGLELSRNLVTVRVAQSIGIDKIVEIAKRFGICANPHPYYSMVLGAMETTVLQITNAYAVIANGGRKVSPSLIDRIQDRNGKLVYSSEQRECIGCAYDSNTVPYIKNNQPFVTDPRSAYQITSILEGVVQHTQNGLQIRQLGKTLAGKTGTSNGPKDTWFIGFSPDLVVGVFVGYDDARLMGKNESGAMAAQPIFVEFMKKALEGKADKPFKMPEGLKLVKIDLKTGKPDPHGSFYEVFKRDNFYATINEKASIDSVSPNVSQPETSDILDMNLPQDEMEYDGLY